MLNRPCLSASLTNTNSMLLLFLSLLTFLHIAPTAALNLNSSSLLLPSPTTNLSIPFDRVCDGRAYGSNIPYLSCADALARINASDTTEQTYGPSSTGYYDITLPHRYISCK